MLGTMGPFGAGSRVDERQAVDVRSPLTSPRPSVLILLCSDEQQRAMELRDCDAGTNDTAGMIDSPSIGADTQLGGDAGGST